MITLPVGMGNFLTTDDAPWNLLMPLSVIYAIPPVIFYCIFRRYLTHGWCPGRCKGREQPSRAEVLLRGLQGR